MADEQVLLANFIYFESIYEFIFFNKPLNIAQAIFNLNYTFALFIFAKYFWYIGVISSLDSSSKINRRYEKVTAPF